MRPKCEPQGPGADELSVVLPGGIRPGRRRRETQTLAVLRRRKPPTATMPRPAAAATAPIWSRLADSEPVTGRVSLAEAVEPADATWVGVLTEAAGAGAAAGVTVADNTAGVTAGVIAPTGCTTTSGVAGAADTLPSATGGVCCAGGGVAGAFELLSANLGVGLVVGRLRLILRVHTSFDSQADALHTALTSAKEVLGWIVRYIDRVCRLYPEASRCLLKRQRMWLPVLSAELVTEDDSVEGRRKPQRSELRPLYLQIPVGHQPDFCRRRST